ncbi:MULTISPECIES: tetrahydrofolate dehydrogenase/cyclohydrolase catalytic domain-containing protein [unclassified Mesorhizobium]|uniref:tetrahydrofolate dehydrogenase/cyclohydrolase catalytic domain-containing protein n=1 Tax=unclassified Mesorhizobium TaxID=325217 RepID=UPI0019D4E43F|nr:MULTISPECIES: tetrahydrofolate dehydrogenase/cyclohydrolase catalytic domain-containing protein [unclassified Mesorhizobium]
MRSLEYKLPTETSQADLLTLIERLNADPGIHGILVQLPLPKHLNADLVINAIDPAKDIDGFHILNVGLLGTGQKFTGVVYPVVPKCCCVAISAICPGSQTFCWLSSAASR